MASVFKRGRWVDGQGNQVSKGTAGAKFVRSRFYTVKYQDSNGQTRRARAFTDKGASLQLAAKLDRDIARGEQGLVDQFAAFRRRPLADHFSEYIAELRSLGRSGQYASTVDKRLAKLAKLCGWKTLASITADSFCAWRAKPIEQKNVSHESGTIGKRTINHYYEALRGFCRWCLKRKRMAINPLAEIQRIDATVDVRRARRALTAAEVVKFLAAVPENHQDVYRFVVATGLRRQELADLQWGDVKLTDGPPRLELRAAATKAKRGDVLPLHADLARELAARRNGAADGERVFAEVPTIDAHREYLLAAGIAWTDSEGRRADFHAMRHTYGTLLSSAGVAPRLAMSLMRHTDINLTMKVYTDPRVFDLAGAVAKISLPERNKWPESGTPASSVIASRPSAIPTDDDDTNHSIPGGITYENHQPAIILPDSVTLYSVGDEPTLWERFPARANSRNIPG